MLKTLPLVHADFAIVAYGYDGRIGPQKILHQTAIYTLSISSNPSDARVYLDGKYIGNTPYNIEVSKGWHNIKIEKDGYQILEDDIKIYDEKEEYSCVLKRTSRDSSLKSDPKRNITYPGKRKNGPNGHVVADSGGIIVDTKTGFEWITGPDKDTTWNEAKRWVEILNKKEVADGYWRMPTRKELKTLYQKGVGKRNMVPLLKTTGWFVWSKEEKDSATVWGLNFYSGNETWGFRGPLFYDYGRVFAVRSRK
ncbi:PEGA domain-containing protein [Thermodesulfobacteriota bacterium]